MFAEFNWWLLIVGLVVGAGLTWLVLADARRREVDLEEADLADEAVWLERVMTERGDPIDLATAEQVLRLHRAYLGLPPAEIGDVVAQGEPAERADAAADGWTGPATAGHPGDERVVLAPDDRAVRHAEAVEEPHTGTPAAMVRDDSPPDHRASPRA